MSSLTELQKSMLEVGECLGVDLQDRRNIITFDDFRDVLHISNIKYSVYPNCIENRYLIEYELSNNIIRVVRETNVNKDSKLITNPFDEEQAYSYYVDNVQDIKEYKIKDNRMEVSQIEVSQKAAGTGGSRLGLKTGDKITIKDLLYGLMLCSGNDAAVALAEYAGGDIQGFAELMNNKAHELGLTNTHYESPHGLDSDRHYTTAYELAVLSDYALKNETFAKIVGTKNYTVTINGYPKNLSNTNELLGYLNGVYGVKTGFTNGANRCLVTACKRNDMDIICVVLGADTKKFRTQDSIKLIEYAFKNFTYIDANELAINSFNNWKNENLKYIDINKSSSTSFDFEVRTCENSILSINKNDINNIKTTISITPYLEAPISSNMVIGNLSIDLNNKTLITLDIININDINRKDILYYLNYFLSNYSKILEQILEY